MKFVSIKNFLVVSTVCSFLSAISALAIPTNITRNNGADVIAIPKGDLPGLGDGDVFTWVKSDVSAYNTAHSTSFPEPTASDSSGAAFVKVEKSVFGDDVSSITLSLGTYDYIFLHWGGQGGGWGQLYYIGGSVGDFTFDAPPGGHPAVGGLSSYAFFGPTSRTTVPDGGLTLVMLGGALTLIGSLRSKTKIA